MGVLSDAEIRKHIADGRLVSGGDVARASECSYAFVPGMAYLAGSEEPPVNFVDAGAAEVVVRPGQMIWIRTREQVSIPHDLVGFWWQTNTLSRKGLMLVNMSMVEPGYSGDLACLFVNFGKGNIPIGGQTTIAKMVFSQLVGTLLTPVPAGPPRAAYDARLRELSIDQPKSFLQVGDLAITLQNQRDAAMAAIKSSVDDARRDVANSAADAQRTAANTVAGIVDDAKTKFREDVLKTLRDASFWAVAAVGLLTLATLGADFVKDNFLDVKAIADREAEKTLRDRLTIPATTNMDAMAGLKRQLDEMARRLATLEAKKPSP